MTMNGEACACSTAMTDLLLTFQMTTNRDLRREEQTQSLTDSYGYRPRKSAVDAVGDARKKREKEKGKAIEPQLSKSRKENQEELQNERTSHKEETSLSNFGRLTVRSSAQSSPSRQSPPAETLFRVPDYCRVISSCRVFRLESIVDAT